MAYPVARQDQDGCTISLTQHSLGTHQVLWSTAVRHNQSVEALSLSSGDSPGLCLATGSQDSILLWDVAAIHTGGWF